MTKPIKKPKGLFVFVDDDEEELFFLEEAVKSLNYNNSIKKFHNGQEALNFLQETKEDIFIIISDLNMPVMDGLEFKRMIELMPTLKLKAIPFFFHSNTSSLAEIKTAYTVNIQGFLKKADNMADTIESLRNVINLWTVCIHPKDIFHV